MAIIATDAVLLRVASVGAEGFPLIGTVESAPAPTIVNWPNGLRTSYTAQTELLKLIPAAAASNALFHARVRLINVPNFDQLSEGVVLVVTGLESSAGAALGDFLVVRFDDGTIKVVNVNAVEVLSP